MTQTTDPGRTVPKRPRGSGWLLAGGGWFWVISASVLLMLGGLAGGYLFGRELARRPLAEATQQLHHLQPENKRLKAEARVKDANIASLKAKLKVVQAALEAISPAKNTYEINSNQSVIVAGGRLTIGLIGSPGNRSVVININGKQHNAVSGDVFDVASDPSTACQVRVQSFDMFKVTINASCAAVKGTQNSEKRQNIIR